MQVEAGRLREVTTLAASNKQLQEQLAARSAQLGQLLQQVRTMVCVCV